MDTTVAANRRDSAATSPALLFRSSLVTRLQGFVESSLKTPPRPNKLSTTKHIGLLHVWVEGDTNTVSGPPLSVYLHTNYSSEHKQPLLTVWRL